MSRHTRRHVLRRAGGLALGTGLTRRVFGRQDEQRDQEPVVWHETYGNGDYQCHTIVETTDDVVLVGRTGNGRSATPWLAAVDADGRRRWTTTFDTSGFTRAIDAVAEDDGITVLVTTDESPAIRLLTLDANGAERSRRSLPGPMEMTDDSGARVVASDTYPDNAHVLFSLPDGYLVGGYHGEGPAWSPSSEADAWVRAVDTDGRTRWNRTYDGTNVADITALNTGFLLAGTADGDAWLQAIDPDGTPRWRHTYGGVDGDGATVVLPTAKGILYGGQSNSTTGSYSRAMLVRTTDSGEFVWRRTQDPQHVRALRPFADGFVLTGEPQSPNGTGRNPEKPVTALDRWGRVQQTVTVSVDPGAPTGLGRFGDGTVAVGGWDSRRGIWLAKIDFGSDAA